MKAFGTDGVRGRANVDITPELAVALGRAVTRELGRRVAIAWDPRPSSPMLVEAVAAGVASGGGVAVRLGVLPTPGLGLLLQQGGYDAGVMVTASHNKASDNGLKVLEQSGEKAGPGAVRRIEAGLAGRAAWARGPAPVPGPIQDEAGATERYVAALRALVAEPAERPLAGRRLVFDAGNGAAAAAGRMLLEGLGAEVVALGDGDGGRINEGCGALHPGVMVEAVRSHAAAAGIALDGDGDRVVLCTGSGRVLDGDAILWVLAARTWPGSVEGRPVVVEGRPVVVGTIMSNLGLEQGLKARGIHLHRTPVGDAEVLAGMRKHRAFFGGEPSGHLLLAGGPPGADGLYVALRVLGSDPAGVDRALDGYRPSHQAHRTVPGVHTEEPTLPLGLIAEIEGRGARVVIRPSGTEPVLRIMVEHLDRAVAERDAQALYEELGGP